MIDFVIVCHSGELELKSLLLVWSLNKYLKGDFKINIAVPIINGKEIQPSEKTITELRKLGCHLFQFQNEYLSANFEENNGDKTDGTKFLLVFSWRI